MKMNNEPLKEFLSSANARECTTALQAIGYESLVLVLRRAFAQAAFGKGAERHANALPFEKQPMTAINAMLGSVDGFLYQAMKKTVESKRLPRDRAVAELLGAINYLAGAVIELERDSGGSPPAAANDNQQLGGARTA
jgi:hypothetical protein